jgi:hypothetical protein
MFNPIKLNLSLDEYCPYDNKIDTEINDFNKIGGNPYNTILSINNELFKYLKGLYIDNINTNKRNKIYFKFDDLLNKKKDISGSSYLGRGGLTSVFAIKYIYQDKNILPEIQNKNLIIRIFDSFYSNDMDEFIDKYNEQKIIFGSNLIQIYLYGQIMLKNKFIGYYTITKTYLDYTQILQLNYNQTVNYFNSFLNFIILTKMNNYFYRDLKFSNIGLELENTNTNTNNNCKFIVLDYDDITLIKNTDDFFTNFNTGCSDKFCAGTLIPYFIIKDYLTLEQNWLDLFDKLYVVGMVDIIINLFFLRDTNTNELLKMIYSPSKYTSCIHYYQYLSLFDSVDKNKLLNNLINNLKPKFTEINSIKKQTLINIIKNLLSTDYFSINNPEIIKEEFKNDIVDLPSEIKTSSGDIVSLDNIEFVPWVDSNSSNTNPNTVTSNDLRFGHNKKKTKYYLVNNKK